MFDGNDDDDEVDGSDIVQGSVGDCFLIGAVSGVANYTKRLNALRKSKRGGGDDDDDDDELDHFGDADPIQRIFVAFDSEWSVYGVLLYKMGGWEWVIVDGILAGDEDGDPLYAMCGPKEKELWPVILEKAYAKLYGSWDAIDGGSSAAATADMTGGAQVSLDLKRVSWREFLVMCQNPLNVLSCGVADTAPDDGDGNDGGKGRCGEEKGPKGLIRGHAYTVVEARETSDKHSFVRVRNPWGNDAEWTGDWGDKSPMWNKFKKYKKELDFVDAADGTFWMSWKDFRRYFEADLVHFFPEDYQLLTLYGTLGQGKAADHTYILHLAQPTDFSVVIGQQDNKVAEVVLGHQAGNHDIVKGKAEWAGTGSDLGVLVKHVEKATEKKKAPKDMKTATNGRVVGQETSVFTDSVYCEVKSGKPGYYCIRPHQMADGIHYYVRVVAPPSIDASLFKLSGGWGTTVSFTEVEDPEGDGDEDEEEEEEYCYDDDEEWDSDEEDDEMEEDEDEEWEEASEYED